MANTSDLDGALSTVCSRFTISCLNPYQKKAISEFVKGKSDIFVNLPTGYGKSLVYQALPRYLRCSIASPLVQVT